METLEKLRATLAGRYNIEQEIGRGGMATVYLARDVRHDRQVAVKVLDPELGAVLGGERFLSEIRVTANLQHPNLLPLFDSGEADGLLFYVMPFVAGETLRTRLDREKQLPVDQAVHLAIAIGNALDYAHRNGVIHRDLKPENILLQAGEPIIADFGIALAVSKAGGARITQTGLSLGTPQYMSPEQATGDRGIDGRTDIYSLAAMTYEMLTGEPPYGGSTSQAIIAKLMTEEPRPITVLRRAVPFHVDAAVRRGLEKLPADRFPTAHDFAVALSATDVHAGVRGLQEPVARSGASRHRLLVPLLAVITAASLGTVAWTQFRPAPEARLTQMLMHFPDSLAPLPNSALALSPDGNHLLYVGPGTPGLRLYIKSRHRSMPVPVSSAGGAIGLGSFTFSPDGQWVAYVEAQKVKKAPIVGGTGVVLADSASPVRGLAWLDDGSIVYFRDGGAAMYAVPANGGARRLLWESDTVTAANVVALPGSKAVLFTSFMEAFVTWEVELRALDLESGKDTPVLAGSSQGWYAPTGHLLYIRDDGSVLATRFDPRSLAVSGDAVPVLDSVMIFGVKAMFAVSDDGTMVARSGRSFSIQGLYNLAWVDRSGRETVIDPGWAFRMPEYGANAGWSLSPDGSRVAIGLNTDAGDDIWIKQLPRGPLSRLSFHSAGEVRPRWSHDGKSVTFSAQRERGVGLVRQSADGTGGEELLLSGSRGGVFEHAFTRDGRWRVLRLGGVINVVGARDIMIQEIGVDSIPRPLIAMKTFDESAFALSPDDRWIAFESDETGNVEVYIRPFPNVDGGKWQVSNGGGRAPLWARNGRELFYVNRNREMVAVQLQPGATPGLGEQQVLFPMRDEWYLTSSENYTPFDISADGKGFLMARRLPGDPAPVGPVLFVDNWFTELKRRTTTRR